MQLDLLCLAPHPDDAELCCGGLLLKAKLAGKKIGVVDFTAGEMGTRGSVALREQEVAAASRILNVDARENLKLRDGYLISDPNLISSIITVLRRYRPAWVLAPHWEDSHPRSSKPSARLCLTRLSWPVSRSTNHRVVAGVALRSEELPYRPQMVLHYNNRYLIEADAVLDISDVFEKKTRTHVLLCLAVRPRRGQRGRAANETEPLQLLRLAARHPRLLWTQNRRALRRAVLRQRPAENGRAAESTVVACHGRGYSPVAHSPLYFAPHPVKVPPQSMAFTSPFESIRPPALEALTSGRAHVVIDGLLGAARPLVAGALGLADSFRRCRQACQDRDAHGPRGCRWPRNRA